MGIARKTVLRRSETKATTVNMALLRLALLVLLSVAGFQGAAATTASNFGPAAESSDGNGKIDAYVGVPIAVLPLHTARASGFVTRRPGSHSHRVRAGGFPDSILFRDIDLLAFAPAARIRPIAQTASLSDMRRAFDSRGPPRAV
jgi:hypothetical protein